MNRVGFCCFSRIHFKEHLRNTCHLYGIHVRKGWVLGLHEYAMVHIDTNRGLNFRLLNNRPLSSSVENPVLSFHRDLIKFQKRFCFSSSESPPTSMMVLM